jgi:hypothetical protein
MPSRVVHEFVNVPHSRSAPRVGAAQDPAGSFYEGQCVSATVTPETSRLFRESVHDHVFGVSFKRGRLGRR